MRNGRHILSRRSRPRASGGQAMIEYLVVLAFGVIVIMQGGSATEDPPVKKLATAIKDYHKHYTYAMAIASIPDCDYQLAYDKSATVADVLSLSGGVTVGFDRCVDWQNITDLPLPSIDLSSSVKLETASIKSAIQQKITDTISGFIGQFVNPSGLLDDMLNFSPSDFF